MTAREWKDPDRLSVPLMFALHLLPGIIIGAVFYFLAWHFSHRGLTGYLALLIAIPLCLVPLELGVLLLWSRRFTGGGSLLGAVRYRRQGTVVDYVVLPIVLCLGCAALSIFISPVSQSRGAQLSPWLPGWATQQALLNGVANCQPTQRYFTLLLAVLLSGFIAPVVEELYFRGFLLPRMEHLGWMAPVVNSLLFAVYHFYFPENVPGIFVAFLLISFVVWVKKDWRIGAIVHSLSNLAGVFSVFT